MTRIAGFWLFFAIVSFAVDQASKFGITQGLGLTRWGDRYDVWPPFLVFRYAENCGINFGIFSDCSPETALIMIAIAVVISVGITIWALRRRRKELAIAAGILVGGALANAFDRATHGAVIDFLNMSCCGIVNPYSFNVADIAIFLGAIWIAIRA